MPVLVDTSVWTDHLNRGDAILAGLLASGEVCAHEIIIGELISGNLPARARTTILLRMLPRVDATSFDETCSLVEKHRLHGVGLNWNDIALLSAAFSSGFPLWTRDRALRRTAEKLNCAWEAA